MAFLNDLRSRVEIIRESHKVDYSQSPYAPLMEGNNYAYPMDIPQDLMLSIVNQYSGTMSKDDMITLARKTYQDVGGDPGYSKLVSTPNNQALPPDVKKANVEAAIKTTVEAEKKSDTPVVPNIQAATTAADSMKKKIIIGVSIAALILVAAILIPKRK